ncbi:MAG: hypothetical protein IKW39_01365 [Alphaproteobacteria bacterium]|nr:hypothetical protein [Alphaproteobacteria bacterium]
MLKEIVKHHVTNGEHGLSVNLNTLEKDAKYREAAINAVVKQVESKPKACIYLPSYKIGSPLGAFINGLAAHKEVKNLKTTNIAEVLKLDTDTITEVLIIKQSFKTGNGLKEQVEKLKRKGFTVSVFCLVAHSGAKLESFAYENGVEATSAVCLDEIPYL